MRKTLVEVNLNVAKLKDAWKFHWRLCRQYSFSSLLFSPLIYHRITWENFANKVNYFGTSVAAGFTLVKSKISVKVFMNPYIYMHKLKYFSSEDYGDICTAKYTVHNIQRATLNARNFGGSSFQTICIYTLSLYATTKFHL